MQQVQYVRTYPFLAIQSAEPTLKFLEMLGGH